MNVSRVSILLWCAVMIVVVWAEVPNGDSVSSGDLLARCPSVQGSDKPSFCRCSTRNRSIDIYCDFKKRRDVLLTKELLAPYDINNNPPDKAYIQVSNATSLNVTSDFMQRLHQLSSAAFDIWYCGFVHLSPPPPTNQTLNETTSQPVKTYAGVGIVGCVVPEVPAGFLYKVNRGAFRIKDCAVDVIRAGFLDKVEQMRYIVIEDSVVNEVEGSVALEGFVTLSRLHVHNWNGLILSNATITRVGPGAFNLTHRSDMEMMTVQDSYLGHVGERAFVATGDINVAITHNTFHTLEREAFRVNVSGLLSFNDNIMGAAGLDALVGLSCYNTSTIYNNTVLVSESYQLPPNLTTIMPFHPSCGKAQLFLVLSPLAPIEVLVYTWVAWVLGAALGLLVVALAMGVAWTLWKQRPVMVSHFPILHKGNASSSSLENLPRNIELSTPHDDPEEGTSVKDLEIAFESESESHQDDSELPPTPPSSGILFESYGEAEPERIVTGQSDSSSCGDA